MMRSGYNNGGLLRVSRCSVFVMNSLILLEYTDWYLWYLVFVSNFGMCYICTVSYGIVLKAYRDMYHSFCIGDMPVCGCIILALVGTEPADVLALTVLGHQQAQCWLESYICILQNFYFDQYIIILNTFQVTRKQYIIQDGGQHITKCHYVCC